MSRAAPVVEGPQRAIVTHAFKLVNDTSIGLKHPKTARLPALKDGDPKGSMEGSFLTIEAKNILIAAMAGSKWDKLVQSKSS